MGRSVAAERWFLALSPSPEARMALASWRASLRLPGRLTPPENFHVTLRFVGPLDTLGQERILAAIDGSDLGKPFSYRLGPLGAFPSPRRATVAWVGLAGDGGALGALASTVDEAAASAGFGYEERPFRGHLTLSRIRPPVDLRPLMAEVSRPAIRLRAAEVVLYRSRLGRGGARYRQIERFGLG